MAELEDRLKSGKPRAVTTYYGANFQHVAGPTKSIVGTIRDKDTKKPLAGFTIQSDKMANNPFSGEDILWTTTDAHGRYRLTGMPKGEGNKIVVRPPTNLPYVAVNAEVHDTPGLDPVTVDFALKRGVWIEGKITDKVSCKSLTGGVEYFSLYSNTNLKDYPGFDGTFSIRQLGGRTKEDGSYRVVGLPGPGLIVVWSQKHYLRVAERDNEYGVPKTPLSTAPYHLLPLSNYGALARFDAAKGVDLVKCDVTLDPGWTFTGTVLGPDGKPLAGARGFGVTNRNPPWDRKGSKTAEFTVRGFNPRRPHDILFQHPEKGLVGVAQPPKENDGAITVRMEPGAVVTGRLVDADGKPRGGVELAVRFHPKNGRDWDSYFPGRIETDRHGHFRIETLLPGYKFMLSEGNRHNYFGGSLRSGEVKDLGDVRTKSNGE